MRSELRAVIACIMGCMLMFAYQRVGAGAGVSSPLPPSCAALRCQRAALCAQRCWSMPPGSAGPVVSGGGTPPPTRPPTASAFTLCCLYVQF